MGLLLFQLNISIYNISTKKFVNINETFEYDGFNYIELAKFNSKNIIQNKTNWDVSEIPDFDEDNIIIICNSRLLKQKFIDIFGNKSRKYKRKLCNSDYLMKFTEEFIN